MMTLGVLAFFFWQSA